MQEIHKKINIWHHSIKDFLTETVQKKLVCTYFVPENMLLCTDGDNTHHVQNTHSHGTLTWQTSLKVDQKPTYSTSGTFFLLNKRNKGMCKRMLP